MPSDQRTAHYFKFIIVFLLFLLLAFDRELANIYLLIMFADYIWWRSDNFISFPIERTRTTRKKVFLETLIGLGIFLFISTLLVSFLSPTAAASNPVETTQSIFHLLATTTPVLQGSKILTFIGWAILVPIIETSFFFGRLLEGFGTYAEDIFNIKVNIYSLTTVVFYIIAVIAALFTLFHITAKGMESLPLLITFVFAIISCVLVIRHKELKGAILLHLITNGAAVLSALGWF